MFYDLLTANLFYCIRYYFLNSESHNSIVKLSVQVNTHSIHFVLSLFSSMHCTDFYFWLKYFLECVLENKIKQEHQIKLDEFLKLFLIWYFSTMKIRLIFIYTVIFNPYVLVHNCSICSFLSIIIILNIIPYRSSVFDHICQKNITPKRVLLAWGKIWVVYKKWNMNGQK